MCLVCLIDASRSSSTKYRSVAVAMAILICYGTGISLSITSNHKNYHLKGPQEYGLLDRTRDKGRMKMECKFLLKNTDLNNTKYLWN